MIDSHVHLGGGKFASESEWRDSAAQLGVTGVVLVQHMGRTNNEELLAARNRDPARTAVIAIPDGLKSGERILEAGAAGFRVGPRGLHAEPGAAIFDMVDEWAGVVSVTAPFSEISSPDFAAIVDTHPSTTFRLEHVAAFEHEVRDVKEFDPVLELALRRNTVIMWSGYFFYSGVGPPYRDAWPVLEASLAAFGADRIVWSGDWNRAGGTNESYLADVEMLRGLPFVDDDTADAILEGNPRRIFGLGKEKT